MSVTNVNEPPRILVIDGNPEIHNEFRKIFFPKNENQQRADSGLTALGESAANWEVDAGLVAELDFALQGEDGYQKVVDAKVQNNLYTLVFCDMRMPSGWSASETIGKIFKADPDVQIVLCSAHSDDTWVEIHQRLGMSGRLLILKKPFDNALVMQIAVSLVEKRRLIDSANLKQEELERIVEERTRKLDIAKAESERLLSAIDSLMLRVDAGGVVRHWNEFASETFALSSPEVIGCSFLELPILWEAGEDLTQLLDCSKRSASIRLEHKFRDHLGNTKIIGFSSYPIFNGAEFDGVIILGADLTESRLREQQLQNALKLDSVGQLAAGVAHEINTPMQYIGDNLDYVKTKFCKLIAYIESAVELIEAAGNSGFEPVRVEAFQARTEKLKVRNLFEQIPEALDDSIAGVGHVSRIVGAMKELSHPGSEEKSAVDVNRSIETTLAISTNEWKYVAEIETDLDPEIELIEGFPGELNQVFLNLIVNAAHAISDRTDEGQAGKGKIKLTSLKIEGGVRVEIEDTGGGIPSHIHDRIFDPFFTTKGVGKGTGQGLAIAHSVVVQKHCGMLSFNVVEGVGTTFIIELPATADELAPAL